MGIGIIKMKIFKKIIFSFLYFLAPFLSYIICDFISIWLDNLFLLMLFLITIGQWFALLTFKKYDET